MVHAVTCVSTSRAELGENPLWDAEAGCLYSLDCIDRKLFRHDVRTGAQVAWDLPRMAGSIALCKDGTLLIAFRRGLALAVPGSSRFDAVEATGVDFSKVVFNDGKCDRRGRFWVGTMHRGFSSPVGGLYRVDPDLSIHCKTRDITLSNGIAWSPDNRTLYHCDTAQAAVWAWDYEIETGEIANRRRLIDWTQRPGRPDGCTVDAEGALWVAAVGASQVVRFLPTGAECARIPVPVTHPTSVMFGGAGLRTLFITSMRHGMSSDDLAGEPLAGAVLAVDTGVAGLPEVRFAR
jgi:sugar lactone lactonase YvrE